MSRQIEPQPEAEFAATPRVPPATTTDRAAAAALAGHTGDESGARAALADPAPAVRAAALGALARAGALTPDDLDEPLRDPDPRLRRRACELAAALPEPDLVPLLADGDPLVAETAAWALGERGGSAGRQAVVALAATATDHPEPLVREAAVAAIGAVGDAAGLPAVLSACRDRPAVRRRAVLALAAFDGPEVDAALRAALTDRDWQVRQAAEDLLDGEGPPAPDAREGG